MAFTVIGENFASETKTIEEDYFVVAMQIAEAMSNEHDMDYVVLFNNGLPVGKWVDGRKQ